MVQVMDIKKNYTKSKQCCKMLDSKIKSNVLNKLHREAQG